MSTAKGPVSQSCNFKPAFAGLSVMSKLVQRVKEGVDGTLGQIKADVQSIDTEVAATGAILSKRYAC